MDTTAPRPSGRPEDEPGSSPPRRGGPGLPAVVMTGIAVALLLTGWGFWSWLQPSSDGAAPAETSSGPVAEYSPDERGEPVQLAGTTLTDSPLDIADFAGQVMVVNVWGSWCVPCREEAPVLSRLSREYADQGVQFVGVNVKDNRAAALAFEDEFDISYPSIEDRDGRALLALSRHVPAQAVPVTLVLDQDHRAAARVIGAVQEGTLRTLLDSVLAEKPHR